MFLRKRLSLSDVDLKLASDGAGKFSGYASRWGTTHHSGDTILPGAFSETLKTNGMPKMFLEHSWVYGGGMPIGKFVKVEEDEVGLYVEGELTPGMSTSQDVAAAMRHGTLDGLSVGGYVMPGDYDETKTGRIIRKWANLMEISAVAFPDDPGGRIETVKHSAALLEGIEGAHSIRELEQVLRESVGLSKGVAQTLVARVKSLSGPGEPEAKPNDSAYVAAVAKLVAMKV